VEDPLGAAHLPQDVDVDGALSAGDVIGPLDLGDGPVDRILDQLLVPLAPGQGVVDLRDDPSFGVVAVGVDRRDGADSARGGPGARTGVVAGGNALAALDQGPNFAAAVQDRLQTLEHMFLRKIEGGYTYIKC
jgi:hypothetical protein